MNMKEYNKVKDLGYEEYCDYLKEKYGCAKYDYFRKSFTKDKRVTRTAEGLLCHHTREDEAPMLCNPSFAKVYPFEYQEAKNLCYCDYLEHLFLHMLIFEKTINCAGRVLGNGGITEFLVPELNDFYSGFKPKAAWQQKCIKRVIRNKAVYLKLLKRYRDTSKDNMFYMSSFNEKFGNWDLEKNRQLIEEIEFYMYE